MKSTHETVSRTKLVAAFLALYVIWGSTYLAIRFAIETLPPFLMAGSRFLAAGAVMYAWARLSSGERPTWSNWRAAAVVGACLLFGGNGGVVWSQQFVPSGLAALIVAMMPVWMVTIEALKPGRSLPRPMAVGGILLGIVGMIVLIGPDVFAGGANLLPVVALLVACFSWAAGSLYARSAPLPRSPLLATGMEMLAGGALLALVGVATGEVAGVDLSAVSTRSALALFYLTVFGSIVAFTAYVWLLRVSTPARVSTYAYVNPVVAVLLGWAFANEPITSRTLVGAAIVLAAVAIISVTKDASRPAGDAEQLDYSSPSLAGSTGQR